MTEFDAIIKDGSTAEENWIKSLEGLELPEWLMRNIPAIRPLWTLLWDDGFKLVDTEGKIQDTAENFFDIYNRNRDKDAGFEFKLDASVDGHGGKLIHGFFSEDFEDGKKTARFAPMSNDLVSLTLLKSSYKAFLDLNEEYLANPNDWVTAYNWLSQHPAFWTRRDVESTFHWVTDNGLGSAWTRVGRNNEGKTVIMFEHGAHTTPDYTQHYHDVWMDCYEETFEQTYVKFAELVNKFFHTDGTERPERQEWIDKQMSEYNPEYQDTVDLVNTLNERVKDLDDES